jgi:hypothetical protein
MSAIEIRAAAPTRPLLDRVAVENARLVRESRDRLLTEAGAVTIAMLAEGRRSSLNAARQWVHRNRKAARLVTIEHEGDVLIPTFQLDEAFDSDPVAADAVRVLVEAGMTAWAVWRGLNPDNGWIGRRPVDAAKQRDLSALRRALDGLLANLR